MKRLMDVVLSVLALVLLAPVLLAAAAAIALESGAPVLFRQTRIGLNGREFGMFKFRSMVKNATSLGPYFTVSQRPAHHARGPLSAPHQHRRVAAAAQRDHR